MNDLYAACYLLGVFFGGCVCGLIPLIVGIVKKRWGVGLGLMILCGICAWFSSVISLGLAIISGIVLGFVPRKGTAKAPAEQAAKTDSMPNETDSMPNKK